ncbi:hypothetical protein ISE1_2741 [plant metagenome]|uniref:Uncharacterized protein n=1 Tax=plant metagenome TaxID=1297885 RepID=A0A484U3R9_9ZZZZ
MRQAIIAVTGDIDAGYLIKYQSTEDRALKLLDSKGFLCEAFF